MKKIVCRIFVCPVVGHIPESQFASGVCGDCGKVFYYGSRREWRRQRRMR